MNISPAIPDARIRALTTDEVNPAEYFLDVK